VIPGMIGNRYRRQPQQHDRRQSENPKSKSTTQGGLGFHWINEKLPVSPRQSEPNSKS